MITQQDLQAFFNPEFKKYPKIPGVIWEWRKGTHFSKRKWRVAFHLKGIYIHVGYFTDFYEAVYSLWIAKNIYE